MSTTIIDTTDTDGDPVDESIRPDPSRDPRSSTPATTAPDAKVSGRRVIRSEWLKFGSVRSNMVALGSAGLVAIGLGVLFSSLAGTDEGPPRLGDDSLSISLAGFDMAMLIVAILGVSLVAVEYQTGLIRTWFASAPDRLRVLWAKICVYSSAVFVVTGLASVVAFLLAQQVYPGDALTLADDGVLQALAGTAVYAAAIAAIGIALGFILRSTAAGAGVVVSTLFLAPVLVSLLPDSLADPIGKGLPSNAGAAMRGLESTTELLSAGAGAAVLAAWVIVAVGSAAVALRRRDA